MSQHRSVIMRMLVFRTWGWFTKEVLSGLGH